MDVWLKIFYVTALILDDTFTQSDGKWFNLSFYYYCGENLLESELYSICTYIIIILLIQTLFLVAIWSFYLTLFFIIGTKTSPSICVKYGLT